MCHRFPEQHFRGFLILTLFGLLHKSWTVQLTPLFTHTWEGKFYLDQVCAWLLYNNNNNNNNNKSTKKEKLPNSGLCRSDWPQVSTEKSKKKDKYLDLARELKKTMEHESDGNTCCNWCIWYSHQRIGKGPWGRVETILTTTCWDRSKYWEVSWKHEETFCHSNSSDKP